MWLDHLHVNKIVTWANRQCGPDTLAFHVKQDLCFLTITAVVVRHGPENMLGQVVGSNPVATDIRSVQISTNEKFKLQKYQKLGIFGNLFDCFSPVTVCLYRLNDLTFKTLVLHGNPIDYQKPLFPKLLSLLPFQFATSMQLQG